MKPSAFVKAASAPFSLARRCVRLARALEMSSRSSSSGMRARAGVFHGEEEEEEEGSE